MAKTRTRPWDAAEHLETEEDMAAYLEAALQEGDPTLVAAALGDIARAKGITQIARERTVANSGFPSGDSALSRLSRPSPVPRWCGRWVCDCMQPSRLRSPHPRYSTAAASGTLCSGPAGSPRTVHSA
jgi:DNA-binding phage protein